MTTAEDEIPALIPDTAIRDLEELWASGMVKTFDGKPLRALRDSAHDQETVGDNPYWDIVRRLPLDPFEWGSEIRVEGYLNDPRTRGRYVASRLQLVKAYAWSIPAPNDIAWIAGLVAGRGVLEIGAGTGYWAWQLAQAGVDVRAYDKAPGGNRYCGTTEYHPVLQGGPEVASLYGERALFLCWPPYDDPLAADALRSYDGDLLIHAGEGECGCTGDDEFFRMLNAEWTEIGASPGHVTYSGIHCWLTAYRRGGVS